MAAHVLDRAETIALAAPVLVRSVERIQTETLFLAATPILVPGQLGKAITLSESLTLREEVYRRIVLLNRQSINFNGNRTFDQPVRGFAGMGLAIRLTRCTTATPNFWPSATNLVTATISTSADGGATWQVWSGFSARGGIIPDGNEDIPAEATESSVMGQIPANANRIRVVASTTSVLRSELTVEVF